MKIKIDHDGQMLVANLAEPLDISIAVRDGMDNPNCFFAPPVAFSPLRAGNFVGSREAGASVNFFNVQINPHGNGTHTECVGHISKDFQTIHQTLTKFHFVCCFFTIFPKKNQTGDRIIDGAQIEECLDWAATSGFPKPEAVVIRTMPNDDWKPKTNYSSANPPYFEASAIQKLVEHGVLHLLTDLPSLDREEDGGALASHKVFWQFENEKPALTRAHATVTELIYAPDSIRDGLYLLNLQIPSFELDAAPSKPVLYRLERAI